MTDLIAEIQKAVDRKSELFLCDAVATAKNTATVGQSTVAVSVPAIIPVAAGDFCQVLEQGLNRVILGPKSTEWANVTLASANWSGTIQWRKVSGRVELRGTATRITSDFTAGGDFIELDTNSIPEPPWDYRPQGFAQIAAATPDVVALGWFIDTATNNLRTTTATHDVAVSDLIFCDGMWWPTS